MTKEDLIFDWKKTEGQPVGKVIGFVIVGLIFTVFVGSIDLKLSPFRSDTFERASVIRFTDEGMARSLLLEAEEKGPFPGRLQVDYGLLNPLAGEEIGIGLWNDYVSQPIPLAEDGGLDRVEIASKGRREFPVIPAIDPAASPEVRAIGRVPVLAPYGGDALGWMPETLPEFDPSAGAEAISGLWRFLVSLRADGTVGEAISLGGGEEAGLAEIEGWLRSVRFKPGAGERWLGLRVDFVNRRDHGTEPE